MRPSTRARLGGSSAVLLMKLLACEACSSDHRETSADGLPVLVDAPAPDPGCLVASGNGFSITVGDVEAMRRRYVPTPDVDTATRLAVDVWLAEWIATGEVGRASLREKIGYQQHLVMRERGEWAKRLRAAAVALGLQHGPCYAPL